MATELINGNGKFNESLLDIRGGGDSFAVVAIMGPQSSGKSTLLNHLFGTNFATMNAQIGRGQTTKGISIAKAPNMEPATLVVDLEGTDSKQRGVDGITFEKQSALFALAVADTVLINMWGNEIGRENAANRPLLRTIFEAMLPFLSQKTSQNTRLNFVVRDKPVQTPAKLLERHLEDDVKKIWEAIRKPKGHEHTDFTQVFKMKVTLLSHYDYRRDDFNEEVKQLKLQIASSHQERHNISCPTLSIFLNSAKKTWDTIKENKNLQVPPYSVLVARERCDQIVSDKLRLLQSDKAWLKLQQNAETNLVKDFGKRTSLILNEYLSKYDEESMYLEGSEREKQRQYLISEALKVVYPAYMHTLGHIRSEALQSYKKRLKKLKWDFSESDARECRDSCVLQFDQQCSDYAAIKQANWEEDVSTERDKLLHEIQIKQDAQYEKREWIEAGVIGAKVGLFFSQVALFFGKVVLFFAGIPSS